MAVHRQYTTRIPHELFIPGTLGSDALLMCHFPRLKMGVSQISRTPHLLSNYANHDNAGISEQPTMFQSIIRDTNMAIFRLISFLHTSTLECRPSHDNDPSSPRNYVCLTDHESRAYSSHQSRPRSFCSVQFCVHNLSIFTEELQVAYLQNRRPQASRARGGHEDEVR